ncbi:MAG: hypothetical protein ACTS6A_02250 [Candidatus Hodgkinia cicadicola]
MNSPLRKPLTLRPEAALRSWDASIELSHAWFAWSKGKRQLAMASEHKLASDGAN